MFLSGRHHNIYSTCCHFVLQLQAESVSVSPRQSQAVTSLLLAAACVCLVVAANVILLTVY